MDSRSSARPLWAGLTLVGTAVVVALAWRAPTALLAVCPPCLFRTLFGIEHCWGCGMTRACVALLRGEFDHAWGLNSRAYLVLPLLTALYLDWLRVACGSPARGTARAPGAVQPERLRPGTGLAASVHPSRIHSPLSGITV